MKNYDPNRPLYTLTIVAQFDADVEEGAYERFIDQLKEQGLTDDGFKELLSKDQVTWEIDEFGERYLLNVAIISPRSSTKN